MTKAPALALAGMMTTVAAFSGALSAPLGQQESRQAAQQLQQAGNFQEALEIYRRLVVDRDADVEDVVASLRHAVECLHSLGRVDEFDALVEETIEEQAARWQVLAAAAEHYLHINHQGQIVAGQFNRGDRRGGGRWVHATQRDRVRALQLMFQAMPLADENAEPAEAGRFYFTLAHAVLHARSHSEAWQLSELTDLETLPDYEEGWYRGGRNQGAPVDDKGHPLLHELPESFEAAATDGQRWRFALHRAAETDPNRAAEAEYRFAQFLYTQFGVHTMGQYGIFWRGAEMDAGQVDAAVEDDEERDTSGTYALHTLQDNETIARLAIGIRRFDLPDEFNFIRIFEKLAADRRGSYAVASLEQLAAIYENRRQYPRAADHWRRAIEEHGRQKYRQQRLDQIVGNWGRFEPHDPQPAGQGATVEFRFRNGEEVQFTASEIRLDELIDDVKDYLRGNPQQLEWQKLELNQLGHRLLQQNQQKYIGRRAARWSLELQPRPEHYDDRLTVTTPLSKAGAYWLTAKMADGNTSRTIVWVLDTVLVEKRSSGGPQYFVADAQTGQPIAAANIELFGYRQENVEGTRRHVVRTKNFALKTNADGLAKPDAKRLDDNHHWLAVARTPRGGLALLGFHWIWHGAYNRASLDGVKVLAVTDRPVYRPEQTVHFKCWVRRVRYDHEESAYAGQKFNLVIHDPEGNELWREDHVAADEFGGLAGEIELGSDARLGVYRLSVEGYGGNSFRVEEYKKPEFEVTVEAPDEPIRLGDEFTATIGAKYYFGSPVTEAQVKYRVMRTSVSERWYPYGPWDWLYGRGYWWPGADYRWYPGWHRWGCIAPRWAWWGYSPQPPEIVAEGEAAIGPDGTYEVKIDTSLAKAAHGDQDHRYEVIAEVYDASRRTIVGTGSVLATRKPFDVTVWVDRGYYRVSQTIHAHVAARTPDGKPVTGDAQLTLLRITYDDQQQPVETPVSTWELTADAQGQVQQAIDASQAGQYRLSCKVTDEAGHAIEGGFVFVVMGEGFDGREFRFNQLELVLDRQEYAPGDRAELLINTDRPGSTVLLYVRAEQGIYPEPQVVRLDGKSTVVPIDVAKDDMPNFFVEALTISDGDVHSVVRQIIVPPSGKTVNVEVEPSSDEYLPGEHATVRLKLTDEEGRPFVGSTVLSVYDKSVEAIAGGTNVPEIREYFWKWVRHHHPQSTHNALRHLYNLVRQGQTPMGDIGVFGGTVVDDLATLQDQGGGVREDRRSDFYVLGKSTSRGASVTAGQAMPAAEAAADMAQAPMEGLAANGRLGLQGDPLVEPTVRREFADTALWVAAVSTSDDGTAEVELDMPENLTAWMIRTWTIGHGTRVGQGSAEVVTRKNLLVRLQAPRFFVETDEVVLSANVHNYLETDKEVQVSLELDGSALAPLTDEETVRAVNVPAGGEVRVDWRVRAEEEGEAVVRMLARSDEESDAMEQRFPVLVHGMLRTESLAGALRPDDTSARFDITIPEKRRPEQSRLEVRYSPSLAGAMVDALPYLVDYPHGCTEQTLNRFLPTVVVQKILLDMNLNLEDIRQKRTNLNAQEIGDDRQRAEGWGRRGKRDVNPVFDEQEVQRMVETGLDRLTEMQLSDGGWGWFSGWGEHSWPHTTATVVHGLQVAQQNDVAIVPDVLQRGIDWLVAYQAEQLAKLIQWEKTKGKRGKRYADDTDALVYMVLADADVMEAGMRERLYRDRNQLSLYAKAMFGLALQTQNREQELAMILRNLEQYVEQDEENQTAYLRLPAERWWWMWYHGESETHAYYLKLLARTNPEGELASRLAKYVINNRRHGWYWDSTRDTALSIEALADYMRASGETTPEMTVEVYVDGELQKAVEITAANLFDFDNVLLLTGDELAAGLHTVELRKRGIGPLYYNAYTTNFTLEDHIEAAGLEIKVARRFFRLVEIDAEQSVEGGRGQVVRQRVQKYRREELVNLESVRSGDLIEIELEIDSKNDYEYLIFEDRKAAGFEPVEVRSGYTGNELGAYVEFRDQHVAFFVSRLLRGKHSVSYRLRAEAPGKFSALPTLAAAMYAPELVANSDEMKIRVEDRPVVATEPSDAERQ